jgi:hypothetical protein
MRMQHTPCSVQLATHGVNRPGGAITFVRAPRPAACIQLLRTMTGALNHARAAPCRSEQVLMNLNVTRLQQTVLVARSAWLTSAAGLRRDCAASLPGLAHLCPLRRDSPTSTGGLAHICAGTGPHLCRDSHSAHRQGNVALRSAAVAGRALLGTFGEVLPESNTVPWAKPCVGRAGAAGFDAYSPFACYLLSYGEQGNKS